MSRDLREGIIFVGRFLGFFLLSCLLVDLNVKRNKDHWWIGSERGEPEYLE
jgi:hypothetical protein